MSDKAIQVAVIGCGRVAGHHCRSIVGADGVALAAVCDLVEERAADYGKKFNVPYFLSYREMFRVLPQINTVAVVTPSGMHFEHAMEFIRLYKKNVIVEKPTFMRPSQVREAYALAERLGLHVFPVFQNRYNHAVCRVRKALRDGELGEIRIVSVRLRWCRPQRYYDMAPWRGKFSMDGGALTNQGIHHLDLCRHLGGEVARVSANMRTLAVNIEVEDTVTALLDYKAKHVGVMEVTTAARPLDFEASISLVCDKGLAQIGGIAVNELQVFTPDPSACAENSEDFGGQGQGNVYGHGHGDMYRDISAFLNKGTPYPVAQQDCLNTIKLLHAFYRSAEAGDWADVDSDQESSRLGRPDDALANIYRTPHLPGDPS